MDVQDIVVKALSGIISGLVTEAIRRLAQPRSKVIAFVVHAAGFTLPGVNAQMGTHAITLRNSGSKAAVNVRLAHGYFPPGVQIQPPGTNWRTETTPQQQVHIVIPDLPPRSQVTVAYLYFAPNTWADVSLRESCDGQTIPRVATFSGPMLTRGKVIAFWLLVGLGVATIVYWLIHASIYAWPIARALIG